MSDVKARNAAEIAAMMSGRAAPLTNEPAPRSGPCTWHGCTGERGYHAWLDAGGEPWAHLCHVHHRNLDRITNEGSVASVMDAYVLAQGGIAVVSQRMPGRR